ncbi:DUF317 domain-containing protein [Streptomyces sp. G44]|uniref:DUF317 domain-containing protein n=1 Tax=Streptomyces sp. G44 TaxID=2807632 RepID=UPI00195FC609|nr:DUF317 domain-containing protein [Streptomyces sp. G44]MBM7166880.1 DUF317 domain-containing protein [Streptomyces sp. G44]
MPVSERQLAAFADKHAWRIPFDTSPRHLAGPGDARHVTHGLAAAGWTRTSDPLSAEIVLRSPDYRHSLQFDPQSATSAWWRLRAEPTGTEPGWYAEFGELVPAEILGSLTDALVSPPPTLSAAPLNTLEDAGWLIDGRGSAFSDPPGCTVERRTEQGDATVPWGVSASVSWHVEAHDPEHSSRGPRLWHAWFDGHTPTHLVHAFVTTLADSAPLQRGMYDRTAHHGVVQKPSPLTPEQVVEAHTARLTGIRRQAHLARRRRPEAVTPPVKESTTRSTARR